MENAKNELLELIKDKKLKCAQIAGLNLKIGFTIEERVKFINDLDFEYDSGYGGQELYGTVWFEDNTWAERGEYDGSEWWNYKSVPEIPEELA